MPIKKCPVARLFMVLLVSAWLVPASRADTIYLGSDGGGCRELRPFGCPNSFGSSFAFRSSLQSHQVEDFEDMAVGSVPESGVRFGVVEASITGSGQVSEIQGESDPGAYPMSGTRFFLIDSPTGQFTLTLSSPADAIGFHATDIGDLGAELTVILDGTREFPIELGTYGISGSAVFFGIVSESGPFSTVTVRPEHHPEDGWGIDDLMIGWTGILIPAETGNWGNLKVRYR
ncbi:MAG: hypothetical protein IPK64_19220 [bacterium]|nr:hypothetical protein [bacterium]